MRDVESTVAADVAVVPAREAVGASQEVTDEAVRLLPSRAAQPDNELRRFGWDPGASTRAAAAARLQGNELVIPLAGDELAPAGAGPSTADEGTLAVRVKRRVAERYPNALLQSC